MRWAATERIVTVKPHVSGDTLDPASMNRVCPECDGANVRRSSTPQAERTWRNSICARYRCRDCLSEFWVIRRRTYMGGVTLLAAILLAILAAFVMDRLFSPSNDDFRSEDGIGHHARLTEVFRT
jgi:hypothetical protein